MTTYDWFRGKERIVIIKHIGVGLVRVAGGDGQALVNEGTGPFFETLSVGSGMTLIIPRFRLFG